MVLNDFFFQRKNLTLKMLANIMDPDRSVGPDLDPNWLTLRMIFLVEKVSRRQQNMINYPTYNKLTPIFAAFYVCCIYSSVLQRRLYHKSKHYKP